MKGYEEYSDETRLQSIRQQCLSMDSIYESLKIFDKLYEKMSDYEKKNFVRTFIERIELYEDKTRKNGNPIKAVHFKFPVAYNGETVYEIVPPNSTADETKVIIEERSPIADNLDESIFLDNQIFFIEKVKDDK